MADLVQYYATGRRKTAVARVFLRPGSGDFKVNGRPFEQYFVTESQRSSAKQALVSSESAASFNVIANVSGGGVNGQAGATKMGIARALLEFNIELRKKLKAEGFSETFATVALNTLPACCTGARNVTSDGANPI